MLKQNLSDSSVANFVLKAYQIINGNEHSKVIAWMNNGKEFTIKDIEQFQQLILPKYFRHRNINSFIRQLNMYGFHKSRKEPSKNIFSHPFFQKDKADQLMKVRRKIKNQENQTPKKSVEVEESQQKIVIFSEKSTAQKQNIQPTSVTSILIKSEEYIEKQNESNLKGFISKSSILDINPEICLKNGGSFLQRNQFSDGDEDEEIVSIADQIERERTEFNNRTQGISIVRTSNFLQDFEL